MRRRRIETTSRFFCGSNRGSAISRKVDRQVAYPCPGFWRSRLLSREAGVVHAMTRGDLNMALSVGPDIRGTTERRRLLCDALCVPFDRLTSGRQVHGTRIAAVTGETIGRGRDRSSPRIPETDGLITNERNVPLMVLGADCALIAVYDTVRRVIGVAHAGWRGTAAGMSIALVRRLATVYGSRPSDLVAAVSPCAGACCYEVGADVLAAFRCRGGDADVAFSRRNGAWFLDLAGAVEQQLCLAGLSSERIERAAVCTICNHDYFSFRRQGRSAGQSALIVAIS